MAAESRVNGEDSGFFKHTVESLRNHVSYTLAPHVEEILRSVTNLVRAEQAHLAKQLEPTGVAAQRASIALAAALGFGLFTAIFVGCALVAVVVLSTEQPVAILLGIGAVLLLCAGGLVLYFVHALRAVKSELSNVGEHYKEVP